MTPKDRLHQVPASATDAEIAALIADSLVFYAKTEWYRYRINHDISPPKCLACPVPYDWSMKGFVGVETTDKARTRKWLTDAALAGYRIEEIDAKRKPLLGAWIESIDTARRRAEMFRRPKPEFDDDDIPF